MTYLAIAFIAFSLGLLAGAFLMVALITGKTEHVRHSDWARGRYKQ